MRLGRVLAGFLLGTACTSTSFVEPAGLAVERTPAMEAGIRMALDCGKQERLVLRRSPNSLIFFLVDGESFDRWGDVSARADLDYIGEAAENRIYLAKPYAYLVRLSAHESLHSLFGLRGTTPQNHDPAFAHCNLLVI